MLVEVAQNGLGDRSLRDLAGAVGTSHRMLIYHFGSRDGLVAAIVEAMEAMQRHALASIAAAPDTATAGDVVRTQWDVLTSAEVRPFVQLFFEAVAYASRHGGAHFTTPWLVSASEASEQLGLTADPVAARLGVAVMRGLLIDVITGDDPVAARAALELFITAMDAPRPPVRKRR